MLEKKFYANGQPVHEIVGEKLTYYYKNGKVKAQGQFINNQMEFENNKITKQNKSTKR